VIEVLLQRNGLTVVYLGLHAKQGDPGQTSMLCLEDSSIR
jgi:hypothetical protein